MAIDFARGLFRQAAFRGLFVAGVHLLVTFVAVESAAERFRFRILRRFQFRQPTEQHVDLKHAPLVRRVRLIGSTGIFREDVAPEIDQKKSRFDALAFSIDLKFDNLFLAA